MMSTLSRTTFDDDDLEGEKKPEHFKEQSVNSPLNTSGASFTDDVLSNTAHNLEFLSDDDGHETNEETSQNFQKAG